MDSECNDLIGLGGHIAIFGFQLSLKLEITLFELVVADSPMFAVRKQHIYRFSIKTPGVNRRALDRSAI